MSWAKKVTSAVRKKPAKSNNLKDVPYAYFKESPDSPFILENAGNNAPEIAAGKKRKESVSARAELKNPTAVSPCDREIITVSRPRYTYTSIPDSMNGYPLTASPRQLFTSSPDSRPWNTFRYISAEAVRVSRLAAAGIRKNTINSSLRTTAASPRATNAVRYNTSRNVLYSILSRPEKKDLNVEITASGSRQNPTSATPAITSPPLPRNGRMADRITHDAPTDTPLSSAALISRACPEAGSLAVSNTTTGSIPTEEKIVKTVMRENTKAYLP